MDGVELARQAAARLHHEAVARGSDPLQPYAFAVAEAGRLGFDVEAVLPGAAMLDGGRATLIPKDQLILHERAGSHFEQAFLIAHEIGHAELGDSPEEDVPSVIDPARPAEAAPVGFDRVVDYGRRQRREVQMDLFAREFLLPRPVAKRLHLHEGLTASEIAERFGAPFDVVAQQLFDALLLPEIQPRTEPEQPERPLNPEQAEAATHLGGAYLLEAGPGTGKTQTLTARVEFLLGQGVDPRRILVLTFSNKAAGEMADRIAHKNKAAAAAMWIGTFHAFGLDLIRRFHKELGLEKDPRMMDRTEAVELLEREFVRLSLRHYRNLYDPTQIIADVLGAISRAKDEVVDPAGYAKLADAMLAAASGDEERVTAEKAREVADVYAAYETLKSASHSIDFGDLVALPVRLLEGSSEICAHLQAQYDHILVDEYQDVNASSVRLLTALRSDGANLWAVGDAKQSIYRFRGASPFSMRRFGSADFPGGVRGRLKKNYRSVDEVVSAFSSFAVNMSAGDADSGLDAVRGKGGHPPELRTVQQATQQTAALADAIAEMLAAGHAYRDQAVLCTGNEKLSSIGRELERLGVPVLFLGSLFERPEVKDLLALLSVLTDRRAMGLVRVACWPEFPMTLADVQAVLAHLENDQTAPCAWLEGIGDIQGLSAEGQATLAKLSVLLSGMDEQSSPWPVMAKVLLDRTRITARLAQSADVGDRTRCVAIWQLLNFLRSQPSGQGLPVARLLDRIRRLIRLGDERDLRQLPAAAQGIDAVRLMTIHGAKGLEFPVIHLPGMNKDTMPRTASAPACPAPEGLVQGSDGTALEIYKQGHADEQECLFYVAISRARDRLFLFAPRQKTNGHNRPLSPFTDRLGGTLVTQAVSLSRELREAPEDGAVDLEVDGGMLFSDAQLALYGRCPRRFFYTHVLGIGGRRTMTPFMHMHEAVRETVRAIISGRVPITDADHISRHILQALSDRGLHDGGMLPALANIAAGLVRVFVEIRQGETPEEIRELRLQLGDDEIRIRPDDLVMRPGNLRTLRKIQTGHARSGDGDDVAAAAFLLAAQDAYPDASVELLHLADEASTPVTMTPRVRENRRNTMTGTMRDIRAGNFPTERSERTCPGCPAFFICGPAPSGELRKKF